MKKLYHLSLLTLLLCMSACADKTNFLYGDVVDRLTEAAIADCQVTLQDASGKLIAVQTTGADGRWGFEVETGDYALTFAKEGYATATEESIVVEYDKTRVKVVVRMGEYDSAIDIEWSEESASRFADGDGSKGDPYIIKNSRHLQLVNDYSDCHFRLADDIDLKNKNWTPIERFSGVLDGNGHTIYNLRVERDDVEYRGLIGNLYGGTVKNLTLRGVTINGDNAGAVAGHMTKTATISHCSVVLTEGSLLRGSYVGGVAGSIAYYYTSDFNTIEYCTVESLNKDVAINGYNVGGIVGYMSASASGYNGGVTHCSVRCDIVGEDYVGGIAGYARNMLTIENCEYDGHISGANAVGGICGNAYNAVQIIGCKVEADIEGDDKVGGISGEFSSSHVIACYSHGTIEAAPAATHVGGIIGGDTYPSGLVALSYSATTCSHRSYLPIFSPSHVVDSYSVYDTDDIALQMEEAYSDYADFWNFDNTWTWSGKISGKQRSVRCPRLAWEK